MRSTYPTLGEFNTVEEVVDEIVERRNDDVTDFINLDTRFVAGRKTARIPSGSADVLDTDNEGDIAVDTGFLYILIDVAGTLVWRRATLAAF